MPESPAEAATGYESASGQLWIIAAEPEVARAIESRLRNAGHPLRAEWLATPELLELRLQGAAPDLLLIAAGVPGLPRDRVLTVCRRLVPDLPLLFLEPEPSPAASVAALSAGARDAVGHASAEALQHLELVVLREVIQHQRLRELRATQARLASFEARHQQLTDSTGDAVAIVHEGIVTGANAAFVTLLGHADEAALAGLPLIDLVDPAQRTDIKDRLRAVLKGKATDERLELRLLGAQGTVAVQARLILGEQDQERVIELLIRAPQREPVTVAAPVAAPASGSRAGFLRALAERTPPAPGTVAAALLIRVDGFRALETRIGPAAAAELVDQLTALLAERLGEAARLFAFSTDEIAVLLARDSFATIETLAEALRGEISGRLFTAAEHDAQLSLSIAIHRLGGDERAERVAHELVSEARRLSDAGGNRQQAVGAATSVSELTREELQQGERVRQALADGKLRLAFQTIASLEGENRQHYDVLLRLLDEQGNEQHASEFLPAAERMGLMPAIDRWVLGAALESVRRADSKRPPMTLFVKLSEDSVGEAEALLDWLRGPLAAGRPIRPEELVIEIKELAAQNHVRKAKLLADGLAELGIGFALEHFGIGANPTQLLAFIPMQYVKFHASYTQQFGDRERQRRLTDLVEAAKQRRVRTIVSHVENASAMARLWQMGVNFVQGYHIKEPEVVLLGGAPAR